MVDGYWVFLRLHSLKNDYGVDPVNTILSGGTVVFMNTLLTHLVNLAETYGYAQVQEAWKSIMNEGKR